VAGHDFGINFIPHTRQVTTWGDVAVGDMVNLEIDALARYVARLAEAGQS
jgi:riboflavin synthase